MRHRLRLDGGAVIVTPSPRGGGYENLLYVKEEDGGLELGFWFVQSEAKNSRERVILCHWCRQCGRTAAQRSD